MSTVGSGVETPLLIRQRLVDPTVSAVPWDGHFVSVSEGGGWDAVGVTGVSESPVGMSLAGRSKVVGGKGLHGSGVGSTTESGQEEVLLNKNPRLCGG